MFLFKDNPESEAERLVSDLFLNFEEVLDKVIIGGLQFHFNIFR